MNNSLVLGGKRRNGGAAEKDNGIKVQLEGSQAGKRIGCFENSVRHILLYGIECSTTRQTHD